MSRSHPEAGTEALDNTYLDTVLYQYRTFQRYSIENNIYFAPVDEDEDERLRIQHNVFCMIFDNRLIFPPINNPQRILECGYGNCDWSISVAESYPDCEVLGVDISPHLKPEETPENLYLQVDDLNKRFTFESNSFDLVHSSLLASGIDADRWNGYLRDIHRVLKPGGWVQMVEIYFNAQSDNGSLTDNHALRQWSTQYFDSMDGIKDLRAPIRLASMMAAAGYVDIEQRMIPLPLSAWSSDPRENAIGAANRENVQRLLSSHTVYPFLERSDMTAEDMQVLVAHARNEADQRTLKAYFPLYVCIGRKSTRR